MSNPPPHGNNLVPKLHYDDSRERGLLGQVLLPFLVNNKTNMRVFVTVGTTEFDELFVALDSACGMVCDNLRRLGCKYLTLQVGRGKYVPEQLLSECARSGIDCSHYRFKDTLAGDMQEADLIISHCGAGSILEAIRLRKLLVLVVNPALQENHQSELAFAMTAGQHCLCSKADSLPAVLDSLSFQGLNSALASLRPFQEPTHTAFPQMVDSLFH